MSVRLVLLIVSLPIFALYWALIEPILLSKYKGFREYRVTTSALVFFVFATLWLFLINVPSEWVVLFAGLSLASVLLSYSILALRKKEEEIKLDLREKDLILWDGEVVEIRSVGNNVVKAISENGEYIIPIAVLKDRAVKKLRKILPQKVTFSIYFPVEIYTPFVNKLKEFLNQSTSVLVSPPYGIEFVSVALNEVELKVSLFTENLDAENRFWEEFFTFLDKEKLSVNRILKHGEVETDRW